MKFFSYQFPNLSVTGVGVRIKFEDGVYEPKTEAEQNLLMGAGFPFLNEAKPEKDIEEQPIAKKKKVGKPKE